WRHPHRRSGRHQYLDRHRAPAIQEPDPRAPDPCDPHRARLQRPPGRPVPGDSVGGHDQPHPPRAAGLERRGHLGRHADGRDPQGIRVRRRIAAGDRGRGRHPDHRSATGLRARHRGSHHRPHRWPGGAEIADRGSNRRVLSEDPRVQGGRLTRMSAPRRLLLGGLLLAVTLAVVVAVVLVSRDGGGAVPSFSLPSFGGRPTVGSSASAVASSTVIGSKRVWLIVMENRSYSQVIDDGDAPFINALAARYGLATDYHGVARPSQPNYLALISGSTQGVSDDGVHDLDAKTLLDQLEAAGHSWHVYAENVPAGCYRGATARNGPDGYATYARKHEPAISFLSISRDPARCGRVTNL